MRRVARAVSHRDEERWRAEGRGALFAGRWPVDDNPAMPRILAIDVGTKTLGLAMSDETATVGLPLTTLRRAGLSRDVERLSDIVREREVAECVVGLPLNLDGSPGRLSEEAERVSLAVAEACGIPVHRWDERMTTVAAERVLLQGDVSRRGRRKVIDKLAATLILQGFLDRRKLDEEGAG